MISKVRIKKPSDENIIRPSQKPETAMVAPAGLRTKARASGSECVHVRGERGGASLAGKECGCVAVILRLWHKYAGLSGELGSGRE